MPLAPWAALSLALSLALGEALSQKSHVRNVDLDKTWYSISYLPSSVNTIKCTVDTIYSTVNIAIKHYFIIKHGTVLKFTIQ